MKVSVIKRSLLGVAALCLCTICPKLSFAEADVMVYPTRVLMTDSQKVAQVDILNTGQVKSSYKISLVRKRMTEAGNYEDVTTPEPAEKFADDMVKFSPRQVTLMPGASQTIRLMFKVPPELADGEYRSHLVFTKLPSGIKELPDKLENDTKVSMKITVNVGISIPVVARHGRLEANATIDPSSVKLTDVQPKQQLIAFTISRSGTRSVYGDLTVYRGEDKVAMGNGYAVFTPNARRTVGLHVMEPYVLKSGENIRVVFTEKNEKKPLAETAITLP